MRPKPAGSTASASWPTTATLRYPKDGLGDSDSDHVQFEFFKYNPPFSAEAFNGNQFGGGGGSLSAYNQSASSLESANGPIIKLYMPEDVGAKYGANWGDKNISNQGRAVLGAGGKLMNIKNGFFDATASAVGTVVAEAGTSVGNFMTKGVPLIKSIQEALKATQLDPSLSFDDVLGGITGQILNPNTEVLYTGPQMRGFGLSFKMTPRNEPEAKDIKNIIQSFKYAILPRFNGDASQVRAFVGVPYICDVTFMKGGSPHPYVTQFKPCAITGFDVSYTPDGAWATYANGSPVSTTISIEFKELKMVYAEEISNSGGTY